jgi:hypothetical protein
MWADHIRTWPAERAKTTVERANAPEGSWRGDGGQYLSPEQQARVKRVVDGVHQAEPTITGHAREAERQSVWGGEMVGLGNRLKGEERLKEKIADELEVTPAMTPEAAMRKISDAIRYTFCFESENYADGCADIRQRLESYGYEMIYSKNYWSNPEYKGINTRWMTGDGQRFEVQFHTPESYHAKQEVTHGAYERIRNPLTQDNERPALEAFQGEVSSWITVPERAADIRDYRRKAR